MPAATDDPTREPPPERSWLDIELGRIWLLAELCLRHLQRAGLRPQSSPAAPDLATVLAARAAARGGSTEIDALAASLTQADRDVEAARRTSPAGQLARRLGLSRLELETLMLAVSPHIDPPLADLFHVVRGGPRRGVNLALVTQLLRLRRDDRVAVLSTLDPERPLVAWRLIEVGPADASDASATSRAIQPTFGLIELLGGGGPSSSLARQARLIRAPATLDDLVLLPRLRDTLTRMSGAIAAPRAPWTLLWGIAGTGKTEISARLAAHAGQPLLAFDVMAADKPARPELLRLAQRDALALGAPRCSAGSSPTPAPCSSASRARARPTSGSIVRSARSRSGCPMSAIAPCCGSARSRPATPRPAPTAWRRSRAASTSAPARSSPRPVRPRRSRAASAAR
jgi:hypothetical protein